jgi:hypothetical protein
MVNRAFRQALGVVIGLVVLVGLFVTIPELLRDNYGAPLRRYLTSLSQNDAQSAYEMLCEGTKRDMTFQAYSDRLRGQLTEIGEVKEINPLRGGTGEGYTALIGSRRSVSAVTPMKKEDGRWKPCPMTEPLGRLEPYR